MILLGSLIAVLPLPAQSLSHAEQVADADQRAPMFFVASNQSGQAPTRVDVRDVPALLRRISITLKDAPLEDALDTIATLGALDIAYSKTAAPLDRPVRIDARDITVGAALLEVLLGADVDIVFSRSGRAMVVPRSKQVALVRKQARAPQNGTIVGQVTDASTGEVIPTADVAIEESQQRATTDAEGLYRLEDVPAGSYTLTASRLGYTEATRNVTVVGDEEVRADFALEVAPSEVEEIVVTGSRIRRAEVDGPSPVTILSRQDIDGSGRATVAEVLAQLPQNFASPVTTGSIGNGAQAVNLRGLGKDNTLVLVNGRRVASSGSSGNAPFVDLNSIPLAAVDRIEVLKDGASALYGSDAVAGVVNIILKQDFVGSEISLNSGASLEGGAREINPSFVTGWAKGGFNALLSGEYFNRNRLDTKDRSFSKTDDLRARGGRDLRSITANPGNVASLNSSLDADGNCQGQNLPGLDAPVREFRPARTGTT